MRNQFVVAVVKSHEREVTAEFSLNTGHLVIMENGRLHEELHAPDSWIALATISRASGWGTKPSTDDLVRFLMRYESVRCVPPVSEHSAP